MCSGFKSHLMGTPPREPCDWACEDSGYCAHETIEDTARCESTDGGPLAGQHQRQWHQRSLQPRKFCFCISLDPVAVHKYYKAMPPKLVDFIDLGCD